MKYTVLFILGCMLCMLSACDDDPAFEFRGDDRIYFSYPKELNRWGEETDREVDSISYSFVMKPSEMLHDTIWIKVKRVGERSAIDEHYKVVCQKDSSSAVEGVDFEKLQDQYIFHKDVGIDSLPLVIYRQHLKTVLSKKIILSLQPTEDFNLGYKEYQSLKIIISDYLSEPSEWYLMAGTLGEYHYMKYEKWIELTGKTNFDGGYSYRQYYATQVKNYFNDNEIIDPLTGERVTCNL